MFDLIIVSVLIRVLALFLPIGSLIVLLRTFQVDLTTEGGLQLFVIVLLSSLFIGALFYGAGCLLYAVQVYLQMGKGRLDLERERLRIQKFVTSQQRR